MIFYFNVDECINYLGTTERKLHKEGIPMRPITSGIGSAPHRLAKCLAKPLSAALGTISCSDLKKKSADLLDRLKDVDVRGKKMASFDVKSLFTNVSVDGAMGAVRRVLQGFSDEQLPLPKDEFISLVQLCVSFGSFQFKDTEYEQKSGLAMGNPLSAVLAPLFMETLEEDHYKVIVGCDHGRTQDFPRGGGGGNFFMYSGQ